MPEPPSLPNIHAFHFISGLLRSDSTLLAALFRQNPRFFAQMSSPAAPLMLRQLERMTPRSEFAPFLTPTKRRNVLRATMQAYYAEETHPVIFDTNRGWTTVSDRHRSRSASSSWPTRFPTWLTNWSICSEGTPLPEASGLRHLSTQIPHICPVRDFPHGVVLGWHPTPLPGLVEHARGLSGDVPRHLLPAPPRWEATEAPDRSTAGRAENGYGRRIAIAALYAIFWSQSCLAPPHPFAWLLRHVRGLYGGLEEAARNTYTGGKDFCILSAYVLEPTSSPQPPFLLCIGSGLHRPVPPSSLGLLRFEPALASLPYAAGTTGTPRLDLRTGLLYSRACIRARAPARYLTCIYYILYYI